MSENAFFWILGIGAAVIAAIGGALWKHIVEDARVRERLAALEADSETTKAEVRTLRDRYHDFRETWTQFITDKLREIVEAFKRNRDDG